jgi:hypothetical protein
MRRGVGAREARRWLLLTAGCCCSYWRIGVVWSGVVGVQYTRQRWMESGLGAVFVNSGPGPLQLHDAGARDRLGE